MNIRTRQILGYLGVIPFIFLSFYPLFLDFPEGYVFNLLLSFYGGVILSFLGGMTWGWEGEDENNLSLIVYFSFTSRFFDNCTLQYVSLLQSMSQSPYIYFILSI